MEQLLALQALLLRSEPLTPAEETHVSKLRAQVPEPIQAHFDRLIARRKKGVAVVRHGVCSECHLRIPIGTQARLTADNEIFLCENCGRYLYLAPEESPHSGASTPAAAAPVKRTRKKPAAKA
jgi:hypothetical protein